MSLKYQNKKTTICEYYKTNTCKFMKNSKLCSFAHGEDDLNKINCIYGNNCYNSDCNFYHPDCDIVCDRNLEINISDIISKNKIKRKTPLYKRISKDILPVSKDILPVSKDILPVSKDNTCDNIKILKKGEFEKIIEVNIDENNNLNKLLDYVDNYYINIINNKDYIIDEKIKIIKRLKNELKEYKTKYNESITNSITNNNEIKKSVSKNIDENEPTPICITDANITNNIENITDDIVIDKKFIKYYKLGKLINDNKDMVNNETIFNYFNNKNISMIKNRCNRIYIIINHMKNNNFKYITSSIRNIFHMKKDLFNFSLSKNMFFTN